MKKGNKEIISVSINSNILTSLDKLRSGNTMSRSQIIELILKSYLESGKDRITIKF